MYEGKCWAAFLEQCNGPINKEHIATGGLFKNKVRVEGLDVFGTPSVEIPIKKLTKNILCAEHNRELGKTADQAAIRIFKNFRAMHRPMELPGSKILRPPVDRKVSGHNLGRWLCKTHCNLMIISGKSPDPEYIRYAFLHPTTKHIYFYFTGFVGDEIRLANSREAVVSYRQLIAGNNKGFDAFLISLAGFQTVVSLLPIQRKGKDMIDRINVLQQPTPLGMSKMIFDWSTEPKVDSNNG